MNPIIKEFSEKRLGDIALIGVKFTEHLVCQCVNDILVAVIDIGLGQHKVEDLAFLIAQQMQFEAHIPAHRALAFFGNPLEYLHGELSLVVYDRYTGAVNKTDAGALAETCQSEEHRQGHETPWHDLHEAVIREGPREELSPVLADASEVIMLEVAERVEVKADQDGNDLGIGHHPFPASSGDSGNGPQGIFRHLNFKFFTKIIGNTKNFSNFTFGYHDKYFIVWYL